MLKVIVTSIKRCFSNDEEEKSSLEVIQDQKWHGTVLAQPKKSQSAVNNLEDSDSGVCSDSESNSVSFDVIDTEEGSEHEDSECGQDKENSDVSYDKGEEVEEEDDINWDRSVDDPLPTHFISNWNTSEDYHHWSSSDSEEQDSGYNDSEAEEDVPTREEEEECDNDQTEQQSSYRSYEDILEEIRLKSQEEMKTIESQFMQLSNFRPGSTTCSAFIVKEKEYNAQEFYEAFPQFARRHLVSPGDFNVRKLKYRRGARGEKTYFCMEDTISVLEVSIPDLGEGPFFTTRHFMSGGQMSFDCLANFKATRFLWRPVFNRKHYFYNVEIMLPGL